MLAVSFAEVNVNESLRFIRCADQSLELTDQRTGIDQLYKHLPHSEKKLRGGINFRLRVEQILEVRRDTLWQLSMHKNQGRKAVKACRYGNRSLKESRINRHGLSHGAPALASHCRPGWRHLSLEDYYGRKVLLIFSDPECGLANRLLPQLKALDASYLTFKFCDKPWGLREYRLKVREYELSFPGGSAQRQWKSHAFTQCCYTCGLSNDEQASSLQMSVVEGLLF